MDVETVHIPHYGMRTLMEVGAFVGLFVVALGFLACSLHFPVAPGCCTKCWNKLRGGRSGETAQESNDEINDDDDDSSSYIDDAESGLQAPHVFESLNELVFFDATGSLSGDGVLATNTNNNNNNRLPIPNTMEKIFPDLLAPNAEQTTSTEADASAGDLREPLL